MSNHPSRRAFIHLGTALCIGTVAFGQDKPAAKPVKPPPIEKDLVQEFVKAAHADLDKTRMMLDARATLLNATWDWGNGDFEAAIGGAGHMGRADIAQFLIDRGARFDIFVAAMMGKIEIVRAAIQAFPAAKNSLGPHGIPLMAHARKGGPQAAEVAKFLESLG